MNKKVYLFDVDDVNGKGIFRISHVESPAIESNFIFFSKEDSFKFAIDEEKMRLVGAIIVPNKEMYRKSLDGYAKFSESSIEKSRNSFKRNNNMFAINVEHTEVEAPSFLLEDWIVEDPLTDKANVKYNLGLEVGSWVGMMQITDKDYWDTMIKTGRVKGFSVEIDPSSVKIKEDFNMEKEIKNEVVEVVEVVETVKAEVTPEVAPVELKEEVKLAVDVPAPVADVQVEVPVDDAKVEYISKEEAAKQFADILSRLEKIELEMGDKVAQVEQLTKELEETRSNIPGSKSFVFNKEKKNLNDMTFSQRMKEKVFSQNN